jgi:MFS transporter, PAT family, beta-lactamase induction signal transducer AmpG
MNQKTAETCLKSDRTAPPIWMMGISNSSFGLYGGLAYFAIPQILAAHHVSEARIAGITAAALSPTFWAVVFGPMLDVRFSRRWYATLFAALESLAAVIAVLNLRHLVILEIALVIGSAAAILSTTALGGWLSTVNRKEDENKLSAWFNFASIAPMGLSMVVGGELLRNLPPPLAAGLLGTMVFLPAIIFLYIPAPGPDRRLAGESFGQFSREILLLVRRREVLITLLLFLTPCGSFALTNMLGGLGNDFSATPRMVSLAGGVGAVIPGVLGCLLFPLLAKRMPLRLLYLANGTLGGLFTLSLLALPHAPWTFALALLGQFLFQAISYTGTVALSFEAIGQNNPLAATTFTFLIAATNVPVAYMLYLDGRAYTFGGVRGSFAADALLSIVVCVLIGWFLLRLPGEAFGAGLPVVDRLQTLPQDE